MKKTIILISLAFLSCGVKKDVVKTSDKKEFTEQIKTTTFRKGDTITINVPNIKLKDTVIERVSYKNNTPSIARITYDSDGNAVFECQQALINQTNEINRQLLTALNSKDVETDAEFNPQNFLYAIIVLIVIVLAGFIYLKSQITKL